jgi:uncharacterized protein (DUF1501 family)
MHFIQPQLQSRRAFLQRAGQLAFTGAALPTAMNLAAMGEAAAFSAGNDYKALVCVFLYGGNDYANTIIPYDSTSYAAYQSIRGTKGSVEQNGIALARADIAPMLLSGTPASAIGQTGLQYAMHPSMTGLRDLYSAGQAAILLNCGPLTKPLTKGQYYGHDKTNYPLPPKLFSHNDQQSIWQSSSAEGSTIGWGGNIGDLALSSNSKNPLFTCISVTGNAVFLAGDQTFSFNVGSSGAVQVNSIQRPAYGFNSVSAAIKNLATDTGRIHLLEKEYNKITKRSVEAEAQISSAIAASEPINDVYPTPYSGFAKGNSLAEQLRMVTRLIAARTELGTKRQVFMVSLGGFDLHDNLIKGHDVNMGYVSGAIKSFYDALGPGGLNIADKVTTFTASEFGRTLSSNGDGSDHGWGGHQIIVGGAVKGGAFYGYAPPVSVAGGNQTNDPAVVKAAPENQFHVGQGRLLPTTSTNQYAATLAKWFGVENSDMTGSGSILPYLDNFGGSLSVNGVDIKYPKDLGFMKAP